MRGLLSSGAGVDEGIRVMSSWTPTLLSVGLVVASVTAAGAQPDHTTLGDAVRQMGTTTAGLPMPSLARHITSYATFQETDEFGIAYYEDAGDQRLHEPLYVAYKAQGQPWIERVAETLDGKRGPFGAANGMRKAWSYLLVDCHLNPSAGELLVFTRQLDFIAELKGFSNGFWRISLPDGLVLFVRNMVHFAPAHAEELAVYDAAGGRETQLYPTNEMTPSRRAFIERLRPIYRRWEDAQPGYIYGYDPTWFDVRYEAPSYLAETDTLRFTVIFSADRHPVSIAPPQRMELTVVCRPMTSAARQCQEMPIR